VLKVLVVDDDPAIRLVTKRLLRLLKCDVYEAKDGVEGEAIALELQPDLVLLDIMMPNQDGYETCIRLRAAGFDRPILMFSALLRNNERAYALQIGANEYVQKPITREILSRYLNLDQYNSASATVG
jgi:two-component system response regulator RpaA